MIRGGSDRKLTEMGEAEQQVKDLKRLLAKAEQKIRKLHEEAIDQKQQIRELQAQAKHEDNLAAERDDLKGEIADLKSETRELTRANREQVGKIEALRAETTKLKVELKGRRPRDVSAKAALRGMLQPSLS